MSKALSASLEVPTSAGTYSAALEGLTGVDEVLMRRDPSIPPLYSTGARWQVKEGDPSELRWRYPHDVLTTGWGDCQDLSAYRAAELRVTGEDPNARVRVYPTGFAPTGEPDRFHAVVERGGGHIEDPSVILGMPPIQGAPMNSNQLPAVAGGWPISPSGPSMSVCLGDECGRDEQLARVPDFAPSVRGPTFHVVPHMTGFGPGWKGVHRTPMRDGSAIVGMTRTRPSRTAVVGDGPGLMTRIGRAILDHPLISLLVAPEAYGAARLLMSPQGQATAQATTTVARAASGSGSDGWPSDW